MLKCLCTKITAVDVASDNKIVIAKMPNYLEAFFLCEKCLELKALRLKLITI